MIKLLPFALVSLVAGLAAARLILASPDDRKRFFSRDNRVMLFTIIAAFVFLFGLTVLSSLNTIKVF